MTSPSPPLGPAGVRRIALLVLGIAVVAQCWVLYVPHPPAAPPFPYSDKVIHAIVFAAPVFLALLAGLPSRLSVLLLAAHAPVSELIQHFFLVDRSGDVWDVAADLTGVVLGVVAVRGLGRLLDRRASGA